MNEHADDRQQVDEDAERPGRGEVLDRLHVARDGREDRADLVRVVVAEREALQVLVDPHAQVVRDVLADALGVVVLDVARQGAERRDHDHHDPRHEGELHLVAAERDEAQAVEPFGRLVGADDVVEDDLQRPRRGQAHRRLDEHGDEDDHERARVGPQQLADDPQLGASGGPGGRRERPGASGRGGGGFTRHRGGIAGRAKAQSSASPPVPSRKRPHRIARLTSLPGRRRGPPWRASSRRSARSRPRGRTARTSPRARSGCSRPERSRSRRCSRGPPWWRSSGS